MMDIKTARRISVRTERSAFDSPGGQYVKNQVCVYWLEGRCNRNPCRFMHRVSPPPEPKHCSPLGVSSNHQFKSTWRNPNVHGLKSGTLSANGGANHYSGGRNVQGTQKKASIHGRLVSGDGSSQKVQQKQCQYWVTGNCVHGDKCNDLHSWFSGSGFSMVAMLEGHSKEVTGIALPSGSDKLYSGSKDESIRVWDCHSGQCTGTVKLDSEVGCLISEGVWVFAGLQNAVKAWNLQTQTEFILNGPVGRVCAMAVSDNMLFAGIEGGSIVAWKFCSELSSPELVGLLEGHSGDVVSLTVGAANRLYSGSKDKKIKVWDLENLLCLHTLHGHCSVVTSLLCWDSYLLSGSLDNTLKVWAATESGNLEVVYEHREESGILALCGIHDAKAKPILLCSCKDNSVRLYDLPSLGERGRIFSKRDVHSIQIGCGGLFFTGDETGRLFVWKLHGSDSAVPS